MNVETIENLLDFPSFSTPAEFYEVGRGRAITVVLPAMGTRASYYQPFAQRLADNGHHVLVPDIPGTGRSRPKPSRGNDYGYRNLIDRWLPGIERFVRQRSDDLPFVLLGHSLGAQLGTLATGLGRVGPDALITIAGGHIHYRNWPGAEAAKVLFGAWLFRFLTYPFGYLPGQYVGFGGPQARHLIRDWSRIIRRGEFTHITGGEILAKTAAMLSIGFEGDFYSPRQSVEALAAVLGGESKIIVPDWVGSPHSAWVKHPESTVSLIESWLQKRGYLS